jgi:hypothetical protein
MARPRRAVVPGLPAAVVIRCYGPSVWHRSIERLVKARCGAAFGGGWLRLLAVV